MHHYSSCSFGYVIQVGLYFDQKRTTRPVQYYNTKEKVSVDSSGMKKIMRIKM